MKRLAKIFIISLFVIFCVYLLKEIGRAEQPFQEEISYAPEVQILSHDLTVHLAPDHHRLHVTDRMVLKVKTENRHEASFSLHATLQVKQVLIRNGEKTAPLSFVVEPKIGTPHVSEQHVAVQFDHPYGRNHTFVLEWIYDGVIIDPPREQRHLRFVIPSETAGHIGTEGVYLSGETHWYPDLPASIPTYRINITTPQGWHAVTQGRLITETHHDQFITAVWDIVAKTEALTLVANRFVKQQRQWNGVEIATYLFPEDALLADEYLEASVKYLETYTRLLGPYPFPKFAVVENFFASGLGMPSFTLLGSGVVKRHYVQPYALGHEIVHSWIGNWVFNDSGRGNWVEGLTTYLANYYYDELTGTSDQAAAQRRLMLLGYAIYVRPDEDYPVDHFRHKTNQKDNAIGYQKAAMVFHMLRREIGEQVFWHGIRKLVTDFGESFATWKELEHVFEEVSQRDLRWFFAQWVERKGAPNFKLPDVQVMMQGNGNDRKYYIKAHVMQNQPPFQLRLPVQIRMVDGQVSMLELNVRSTDHTFTIPVRGQPVTFHVDPSFEIFRWLNRSHLPPMLNLFVTDQNRTVVLPSHGDPAFYRPYEDLVARIQSQDSSGNPVVVKAENELRMPKDYGLIDQSVMILGSPKLNRLTEWAARGCGNQIHLEDDKVTIAGKVYEGPELAVLISCRHPDYPTRVATMFYGQTPSTTAKVGRLLFFYGWQSYLIFREGAVVARGDFLPEQSELEIRFHAP